MFCRTCGKEVSNEAMMCMACGSPPTAGNKHCQSCGAETNPNAEMCTKCGVRLVGGSVSAPKSKMAAGLFGIFFGSIGIHRFYLGYNAIAIAQLVLSLLGLVTCGITFVASWIWGLIEGISILTGSINKDASGRPLGE